MDEVIKVARICGLNTVGEAFACIMLHWDAYTLEELREIENDVVGFAEEFGEGWSDVTIDQAAEWLLK